MKNQDKIFKDILNFIKCVSGHLHKYEWTHVFMYASKIDVHKKGQNVQKVFFQLLRV